MPWNRLRDNISRNIAFFPPSPPSYTLAAHGDGAHEAYVQPTQAGLRKVARAEVVELSVGKGRAQRTVVAAFISAPAGRDACRPALLHSHGNAVDLGQLLPLYEQLSKLLNVNVIGYDYAGYGRSGGLPGASATLADISAVFSCLLERYGRRPEEVVVYGQSVGSGPTSWLAARTPGLGGCILHSPFLSGMRVMSPSLKVWPAFADIFPNLKFVPKIVCRTLIIHGTADEVIDISHGRKLHSLCKNPSGPFWAEGAGHQDVEAHPEYIATLCRLLKECFGEDYARPGHLPPVRV